ncbi:MAG: amidase, partial [Candidatus Rokuibacteriota bacterium]
LEDVALLLESCVVHDEDEFESSPRAHTPYRAVAAEEAPIPPTFGFVKTPHWSRVDADAQDAFAELIERLGDRVEEVELAGAIERAWDWHGIIMEAEVAVSLAREWDKGRARLSDRLRARIERGRGHGAADYLEALAQIPRLNEGFTELFEQKYDALLTPAATGIAPAGLASTGDPMFCSLWTLCGLPALSVPLMSGANGLPLGVQLVGARHGDGRLLRTARWLVDSLRRA